MSLSLEESAIFDLSDAPLELDMTSSKTEQDPEIPQNKSGTKRKNDEVGEDTNKEDSDPEEKEGPKPSKRRKTSDTKKTKTEKSTRGKDKGKEKIDSEDDHMQEDETKTKSKKRKSTTPSKKAPPKKKQKKENVKYHIAVTATHDEDQEIIERAISHLDFATKLEDDRQITSTSYIVCGEKRRTQKVLLGLASGSWIVTLGWIRQSLKDNAWADPAKFEATKFFSGAKLSRESREARLFDNYIFHIASHTTLPTSFLKKILIAAGGTVKNTPTKDVDYVILGDQQTMEFPPKNGTVLKETWVFDCLSGYEILDPKGYAVEDKFLHGELKPEVEDKKQVQVKKIVNNEETFESERFSQEGEVSGKRKEKANIKKQIKKPATKKNGDEEEETKPVSKKATPKKGKHTSSTKKDTPLKKDKPTSSTKRKTLLQRKILQRKLKRKLKTLIKKKRQLEREKEPRKRKSPKRYLRQPQRKKKLRKKLQLPPKRRLPARKVRAKRKMIKQKLLQPRQKVNHKQRSLL
eukprot:TRINITY_DN3033_c0_g1_i1.p1 TRINITY_DN3033_c0_g1~~TRINITY_DN3033_c0_g1_i1.p1  ORF type:complete len:520 (+),score=106.85 TRINITY_DN3033_c0_g1_i1:57-1616(+)